MGTHSISQLVTNDASIRQAFCSSSIHNSCSIWTQHKIPMRHFTQYNANATLVHKSIYKRILVLRHLKIFQATRLLVNSDAAPKFRYDSYRPRIPTIIERLVIGIKGLKLLIGQCSTLGVHVTYPKNLHFFLFIRNIFSKRYPTHLKVTSDDWTSNHEVGCNLNH